MHCAVLLEFLLIISSIGTAVVLYPITKRQDKVLAIGCLAASDHQSASSGSPVHLGTLIVILRKLSQ